MRANSHNLKRQKIKQTSQDTQRTGGPRSRLSPHTPVLIPPNKRKIGGKAEQKINQGRQEKLKGKIEEATRGGRACRRVARQGRAAHPHAHRAIIDL